MALLNRLSKDLQDGIADAEHDEKTSQKDYETLMSRRAAACGRAQLCAITLGGAV